MLGIVHVHLCSELCGFGQVSFFRTRGYSHLKRGSHCADLIKLCIVKGETQVKMPDTRRTHPHELFLSRRAWKSRSSDGFVSYWNLREGPVFPGALGIAAKPVSASLTHVFPIQFTLAQKDNSWVCSHPGSRHQSSFPGMW